MREKLCFCGMEERFSVAFRNVSYIDGQKLPDYDGPTSVLPSFETQMLATNGKSLNADIEVEPILVTVVSNPSGGKTLSI